MTIKRNYVVGIIDHNRIDDVNNVIYSYAEATMESSSHLYFAKQPLTGEMYVRDATFFKLMAENEDDLNKKVNNLISDLDKVDVGYVLKDEESGELLSVVEFGGTLFVKFDNLNIIKEGTFKQLDDLKQLKTDFGYTRGLNPNFRPLEGQSIKDLEINPEIIYLISDSSENLLKLRDYVSQKVLEVNSDFELDFKHFRKATI